MPGRGARGRGRGAFRGVGRGRGRGVMRGRGRGGYGAFGRGRGGQNRDESRDMDWEISAADKVTQDDAKYDINTDVTPLFIGTASFDDHYKAQTENRSRYAAAIIALEGNGVDLSASKISPLHDMWYSFPMSCLSVIVTLKI